jgi:uncharacterized protein YceH (UPF0502 family)
METILSDIEIRVLGCLVEKQVTTPEYYPLTLNALMLACNQKNNRYPVSSYSEDQVAEAVERLREKNLIYVFYGSTSRVPKYKHVMPEVLHLSHAELAVLCVLMLRGAQTPGELRSHGGRLHEFSSLDEIEQTLNQLITREPDPLVVRLSRQPGQKEVRFMHLLSGEVNEELVASVETSAAGAQRRSGSDQIARLEQRVQDLEGIVDELRTQFGEFRKQFE